MILHSLIFPMAMWRRKHCSSDGSKFCAKEFQWKFKRRHTRRKPRACSVRHAVWPGRRGNPYDRFHSRREALCCECWRISSYLLQNASLQDLYTRQRIFGGLSQALGHDDEITVYQRFVSLRMGDLVAIASDGSVEGSEEKGPICCIQSKKAHQRACGGVHTQGRG